MKLEIKRRFQLGHEVPQLQPHLNLSSPAEANDKANEKPKVITFITKKCMDMTYETSKNSALYFNTLQFLYIYCEAATISFWKCYQLEGEMECNRHDHNYCDV